VHFGKYKRDKECEIYNLFFSENEDDLLYETINTVIEYE
jgi:hypothetical protein